MGSNEEMLMLWRCTVASFYLESSPELMAVFRWGWGAADSTRCVTWTPSTS